MANPRLLFRFLGQAGAKSQRNARKTFLLFFMVSAVAVGEIPAHNPSRRTQKECPKQSKKDPISGPEVLNTPHGLALDANGNIFVLSTMSSEVVVFTGKGTVEKKWPLKTNLRARGASINSKKQLVVALSDDRGNDTGSIFIIDEKGKLDKEISKGDSDIATLKSAADVALGQDDSMYVADTRANLIKVFDKEGKFRNSIGTGKQHGELGPENPAANEFYFPHGVAITSDGAVFIADTYNHRVVKCVSKDKTYDCHVFYQLPRGSDAYGVVLDSYGDVYVSDYSGSKIHRLDSAGKLKFTMGNGGKKPGELDLPAHIAIRGCTIYVADRGNHRISVFGP